MLHAAFNSVLLQYEINWGIDVSTSITVLISYTSLNIAGILYQLCLLSTETCFSHVTVIVQQKTHFELYQVIWSAILFSLFFQSGAVIFVPESQWIMVWHLDSRVSWFKYYIESNIWYRSEYFRGKSSIRSDISLIFQLFERFESGKISKEINMFRMLNFNFQNFLRLFDEFWVQLNWNVSSGVTSEISNHWALVYFYIEIRPMRTKKELTLCDQNQTATMEKLWMI